MEAGMSADETLTQQVKRSAQDHAIVGAPEEPSLPALNHLPPLSRDLFCVAQVLSVRVTQGTCSSQSLLSNLAGQKYKLRDWWLINSSQLVSGLLQMPRQEEV